MAFATIILPSGKRRLLLRASLTLVVGAGLLATGFMAQATFKHRPPIDPRALRAANMEHTTHLVVTPDGRHAELHCWQSRSPDAPVVVFERQGDRVLVRAVPRTPVPTSQPVAR